MKTNPPPLRASPWREAAITDGNINKTFVVLNDGGRGLRGEVRDINKTNILG